MQFDPACNSIGSACPGNAGLSGSAETFQVEGIYRGIFRDFFGKNRLVLSVAGEEVYFKIPKQLRKLVKHRLSVGTTAVASGILEPDPKRGGMRRVIWKVGGLGEEAAGFPSTIRVCAGKHCRRGGGKELWNSLREAIAREGLEGQVKLKAVGCVDECKRGPNVEFAGEMHRRCGPRDVRDILAACAGCAVSA